ncbi:MAG: hypothetical protein ACYDAG_02445 [Chloroflexota bacterium]
MEKPELDKLKVAAELQALADELMDQIGDGAEVSTDVRLDDIAVMLNAVKLIRKMGGME